MPEKQLDRARLNGSGRDARARMSIKGNYFASFRLWIDSVSCELKGAGQNAAAGREHSRAVRQLSSSTQTAIGPQSKHKKKRPCRSGPRLVLQKQLLLA
jgi:hypothetical protein